jgi:hypothetical protein
MLCPREGPSPASPDVGGPSAIISWAPSAVADHPLPGIDYGTVYHLGTAFVVWSDAVGGSGGSTSSSEQGVNCQGSLLARDAGGGLSSAATPETARPARSWSTGPLTTWRTATCSWSAAKKTNSE